MPISTFIKIQGCCSFVWFTWVWEEDCCEACCFSTWAACG
ncbi:hypothetical protein Lser_V15G16533 [Lactuca serriola]